MASPTLLDAGSSLFGIPSKPLGGFTWMPGETQMGTPRHPLKLAFASLLGCIALATSLPLAQAAQGPHLATAPQRLREALRFWTPARMKQARPLSVRMPAPSALGGSQLAQPDFGRPHRVPALAATASGSDSEVVPDPTAAEQRQNGAVFIVLDHGERLARCSGTSVSAANLSVVFTAGHCVSEGGPGGRWYDGEWVFVPGYHDGVRPFGVFVAKWLGATRLWLKDRSENADVGVAVVSRNERGERLGAAVGGDGIAWGLPPGQVFDVYGYPVAPPFDGTTQRLCSGTPYLGHDVASFLWRGPLNMAVQCHVTGGASGGGWVIPGGLLNGVTDYGWRDDPTTDFGSYFGGDVGALYRLAARVR